MVESGAGPRPQKSIPASLDRAQENGANTLIATRTDRKIQLCTHTHALQVEIATGQNGSQGRSMCARGGKTWLTAAGRHETCSARDLRQEMLAVKNKENTTAAAPLKTTGLICYVHSPTPTREQE
jgi:hypothetical protein